MPDRISSYDFYNEYHGHKVKHLQTLHQAISQDHSSCIFLAGDSSLDNKYWFDGVRGDALNGYERILGHGMKEDVSYWINFELCERKIPSTWALNTSVEATTLGQRVDKSGELTPQDKFIRDHITEDDYLVVSIGGNDIAMAPSLQTIWNDFEKGSALGLQHFINLFSTQVQTYLEQLVAKRKPKKILLCMIYYPAEAVANQDSWADASLGALMYNRTPERLQLAISTMFEKATSKVRIQGTEVVPVPLFQVLDPKNPDDYLQRVEPSIQGGHKMACAFVDRLFGEGDTGLCTSQSQAHVQVEKRPRGDDSAMELRPRPRCE